jgi:hypothetical protein
MCKTEAGHSIKMILQILNKYSENGLQNGAPTSSCNKKAMKKLFNRLEMTSEIQMPS